MEALQHHHLFDLLLWPQLVCVSTLLLTAVCCTGVQPGIAPARPKHAAHQLLLTRRSTATAIKLPLFMMFHSVWPQALHKLTARSKVMKGVCCTVDYSPPKHFTRILRSKLYHLTRSHVESQSLRLIRALCKRDIHAFLVQLLKPATYFLQIILSWLNFLARICSEGSMMPPLNLSTKCNVDSAYRVIG